MSQSPIATITTREVRETLSDWRIVVPITLLTFLLPQLLVVAAGQVIRFVEDQSVPGRLVPFAALLVGFIPASFSLITALESFVGERERNSLESLLAMPVSDGELYISKLCSSLITPLVSSLIAMLIFTFLLYAFDAELYFAAMTLPLLVQLFLMIGLMALTMVAAAVVISSHISSIRAANLMSSFVLIPMALVIQWSAFVIINSRWDLLWLTIAGLAGVAFLLVRVGLATFNREEILSREHQSNVRFRMFDVGLGRGPQEIQNPKFKIQNPPLAVIRRELGETLTDWRVLAPIFVLTFVIPWALVSAVPLALGAVDDPSLIGRLGPFATLLVGFIPSSFALITALESFVGERERNTLESILAMPISDNQLYASKLCSSLVAPLGSSFVAMLVFATTLATFHPSLYAVAMSGERLLQLLVMITVITVMMVAGAVVISSHTSSIRAATLLASAVLIPTAVTLQLQALPIIAARWDLLWIVTAALAVIAVALLRAGLKTFNREEILSREHEQISLERIQATFFTFFREYRPAGVAPDEYAGLDLAPGRFYRRELPALLRELRLPIMAAITAALGGLLLGGYIGNTFRVSAFDMLLSQVGDAPPPSLGLGLLIFANNLRVSILSNVFSVFTFGIFAFLVPAVAFAQIGFVATTLAARGGSWSALAADSPLQFMLAYVAPHGIIELPTFILSAALGLRIGAAVLAPPKGFSAGQNVLWALANFAKIWLLLLLPLILISAMVEGLVTPLVIQALYR